VASSKTVATISESPTASPATPVSFYVIGLVRKDSKMPAIVTLLVKKLLKPGNVELRWKYPASIRILPLHEPGGKRPDALLFGCETGEGVGA
jgi:hypothetical protein